MAKVSSKTPTDAAPGTVVLTQQAVNVVRQLLFSQGWMSNKETFVTDMYVTGRLLTERLPTPDISWVKTEKEILAMKDKDREAYLARDKAWGEKEIPVELDDAERDCIVRAFRHNAQTLLDAGRLGFNPTLLEVIRAFDIKDVSTEKAKDSSKA